MIGVGGIMWDVFMMGVCLIVNMNVLCFGELEYGKICYLFFGVVVGIGGYGNCMGVFMVGGEVNFYFWYNGNIFVNVMMVGLVEIDKIFYFVVKGVGNLVVYVGFKMGCDGIYGVIMVFVEFDDDFEEKWFIV